jgi:hypothetical protein
MKKWILLFILILPVILRAADTKVSDMTQIYDPVATDRIYIVDDPNGTPAARAITIWDLFNFMDTSAELLAIMDDETGTGALVFGTAPTIDSPTFTTAFTAVDLIDSDDYAADSIDNEHINWADIDNLGDEGVLTVADTTDATCWPALFESDTGDLAIKTDGGLIYDASTGTLDATILTESGNAVYNSTETPGGELGGTWASPTIDADAVSLDEIGDAAADTTIALGGYETTFTTSLDEAAHTAFWINHSDSDVTNATYLLQVSTAAEDDADLTLFLIADNTGVAAETIFKISNVIDIGQDDQLVHTYIHDAGTLVMYDDSDDTSVTIGPVENGTTTLDVTGSLSISANITASVISATGFLAGAYDVSGANPITVGSADATLVNVTTDGGTLVLDGSVQFPNTDGSPSATAELQYDHTVTGLVGGMMEWYDGNDLRYLVDVLTLPSDDDYVVAYDADADIFYMKQDADSGGSTAWDDIGNPDNSGLTTITFDNGEATLLTGNNDAAVSFLTIQNTDDDHTVGNMYLLDLDYSADDGDADADFIICQDSGGTVLTIQQNGDIATNGGVSAGGTVEGAAITEGGVGVPNLNEEDWVGTAEMADADHGDVAWSSGAAEVQAMTVNNATDATYYIGMFAYDTGSNLPIYTDGGLSYAQATATLTATAFSGALSGNATTCTTASAGDAALDFFGAGVTAVTDATACTDIEGTGLSITTGTLNWSAASTDLTDTADLLYEAELDAFSELQSQISDKTLVNTADGATWSGTHDYKSATVKLPARVIFCFNIHDIDDGMDDIKMPFPVAMTITQVTAYVTGGTNVVGRLYEVDGDGDDGDAVGVETTDWTFTTGETEDSSFNNATFDAGDYIQWDTTSVSGAVTGFMICVWGYET